MKDLDNTTVGIVTPGIIRKLMRIDFDIIHGQEVFFAGLLGLHIARKQNIPYVQSYHTLWARFVDKSRLGWHVRPFSWAAAACVHPFLTGPRNTIGIFTHKGIQAEGQSMFAKQVWAHMVAVGQAADHAVIPSQHLATTLQGFGLTTDIATIPNGIIPLHDTQDRLLPRKKPKSLRIISVARLSPEKRVDTLIQAATLMKDLELIVVGDGPDRTALEKSALEQNVGKQIRFMGEMTNNAVRMLMREADALALASYDFDNQPMVINEALDAGLPIVYCDPLLIEGLLPGNSLLVDKTPRGFADGFRQLQNPAKRRLMGENSRALREEFTASRITDQILEVYAKVGVTA
jgi:glycosyltransferase involved in cell wall biosynthesis